MTTDSLDDRLHELALSADVPVVTPADDLARGRARLRRQRVTSGGAALATAAVIGLTAAIVGGGDGSPSGTPPVAEQSTAMDPTPSPAPAEPTTPPPVPADRRDADQLLDDWRQVVADHLDPRNRHLDRTVTNVQSGSGLGTKLGWSNPGQQGLGEVQLFVSADFESQWYLWCDASQQCQDVTVGGIDAKVLEEGGTTHVGVNHGGFVVAVSVDALFGNNSSVPVSGLDIAVDELVRLAADERFTMPTTQQLKTADDVTFG